MPQAWLSITSGMWDCTYLVMVAHPEIKEAEFDRLRYQRTRGC